MNRKKLLAAFAVPAATVMLGSSAYACTVWAGKFIVTGEAAAGGGTVTATGTPTGCTSTGRPIGGMNQTVDSGVAKTRQGVGGSVTVEVQPASSPSCNKLPAGFYDINWYSGKGYSNHTTWSRDCMSPLMGLGEKVGVIQVNSSGSSAPATFPIASPFKNIHPEEGAVCVSDATGGYGNQAPMTVI